MSHEQSQQTRTAESFKGNDVAIRGLCRNHVAVGVFVGKSFLVCVLRLIPFEKSNKSKHEREKC